MGKNGAQDSAEPAAGTSSSSDSEDLSPEDVTPDSNVQAPENEKFDRGFEGGKQKDV